MNEPKLSVPQTRALNAVRCMLKILSAPDYNDGRHLREVADNLTAEYIEKGVFYPYQGNDINITKRFANNWCMLLKCITRNCLTEVKTDQSRKIEIMDKAIKDLLDGLHTLTAAHYALRDKYDSFRSCIINGIQRRHASYESWREFAEQLIKKNDGTNGGEL